MLSLLSLSFLLPYAKKIGVYALAIGAIFMAGFFYRGSCDTKKELKQSVETLQDVIRKKDDVRRHHENVPKATVDDWNNILSGRVSIVCGKAQR